MQYNAPSRSLSCLLLVLAGPIGAHFSPASGQSNVRPGPAIGRVPRAVPGAAPVDAAAVPVDAAAAIDPHVDLPGAGVVPSPPPSAAPAPDAPAWEVGVTLHGAALAAADLETAGERSVLRGGWDATLRRRRGDRSVALFLDTEASFYDWSTTTPLPGGATDPFNDLYETRVGALLGFDEDAQVSWFTGVEIVLAGEDSASIGDALSVGAVTGVDVRASDDLVLSFGLAALTRLEDTTWVLPYFGFDWRMTDALRLATDGAGVLLEVELSDAWTATLAAEYELRQFRLNDDNALSGGVYQDDQITLSGRLDWRIGKSASLALTGGLVAWQESTFLDGAGTKLGEVETDPGLYGAVTLAFGN